MTTSADTNEGVARVTGDRIAMVARTARVLAEARVAEARVAEALEALYPKDKPGGGRNASSPNNTQTVNLTIGVCAPSRGEPMTLAPERVRAYRSLVPFSTVWDNHIDDMYLKDEKAVEEFGYPAPSPNLGTFLDGLVDRIARGGNDLLRKSVARGFVLELSSGMGTQIRAHLRVNLGDGALTPSAHLLYVPANPPSKEEAQAEIASGAGGSVARITKVTGTVILALADMWADTLARNAARDLPPSPSPTASGEGRDDGISQAGAKPETENGATGALPGAAETPLNNAFNAKSNINSSAQPRDNGASHSHSCEFRETESGRQARSRSRLGAPPQSSVCRRRRPGDQPHAFALA